MNAVVIRSALSTQTSSTAVSTTALRIKSSTITLTSAFSPSIVGSRIRFYVDTPAGNIPLTGIIADYGGVAGTTRSGQYLPASWSTSPPLGASMGPGSVWSVWYRRQDMGIQGLMLAQENDSSNNFWAMGWREYDQMWFGWSGPTQGGPQLFPSGAVLDWTSGAIPEVPQDTDWHHYLIKYDRWNVSPEPGYPQSQTAVFKFWRDGVYIGEAGRGNMNSEWWYLTSPLQPIVAGYYDGTYTTPGLSGPIATQGVVGQTWIGEIYSPAFNPQQFYNNGYVDLRLTNGTIYPGSVAAVQPYVYTEWDPTNTTNLTNLPVLSPGPNVFVDSDWYITPGIRVRAFLLATAEVRVSGVSSLSSAFSLQIDFENIVETPAALSSSTSLTTVAVRTRRTGSTLTVQTTTEFTPGLRQSAEANLNVTATISATAESEAQASSSLSSAFTLTSVPTEVLKPVSAALNSSSTQAPVDILRTRTTASTLASEFTQSVTGGTIVDYTVSLSTEFTQTASANRTRLNSSSVSAEFTLFTAATQIIQFNCVLNSQALLTAQNSRLRDNTITMTGQGFVLIDGDIIHIDPDLTLVIVSENRDLVVEPESRDQIIISETRQQYA